MMAQNLAVGLIIAVAGLFVVRAVYRTVRGKDAYACHCARGCGCDTRDKAIVNR